MAKKETSVKETAAVARPARAAKPKTTTPRVRTVKHSKSVAAEPVAVSMESAQMEATIAAAEMDVVRVDNPETHIDHHAAISRLAYGYWESGGRRHNSQLEDWVRAEQAFRQSQL